MVLVIRTIQVLVVSFFRKRRQGLYDPVSYRFRVLPFDIDIFLHMNNARYLNYLESARWGLTTESGFLGVMMKNKWITPVSSLIIDYYRPLTAFKKFEVSTQFVRFEDKWCFLLQRVWSEEKEVARALIKATVREGRRNVPPSEYLRDLTQEGREKPLIPTDVSDWLERSMGNHG